MTSSHAHRDLYNKHLLHPWADLPTLGEDDSTSVIVRAEGCYIYDDQGQKMLDGPAVWVMPPPSRSPIPGKSNWHGVSPGKPPETSTASSLPPAVLPR
jgi:hypothetical protein